VILVDTSVWVDHLRKGRPKLASALVEGKVLCHPIVLGELACGGIRNRGEVLALLAALPQAAVAEHVEVLQFVHTHKLHGRGLGWIEVHLLASAQLTGCSLWTNDHALLAAARALRVQ
jgi:predicted nucleic acid-binding protein